MKFQITLACALSFFAVTAYAVDLPTTRSLHESCSQNMVCSDGLYCRKEKDDVYGFCEDPTLIETATVSNTPVSLTALPTSTPRSFHESCSQNMVCSDGLYCRKNKDDVYGFCEDPTLIEETATVSVSSVSPTSLPTINSSLHQRCSQNMACSDGLYCRGEISTIYGTCEDPGLV